MRQEDTPQIAYVLPLPFGVILLWYALAVTLGYKARKTIWRRERHPNVATRLSNIGLAWYALGGRYSTNRPCGSNGEISGAKQTDSHGCETAESTRKADRKAPIRKLDLIQTVKELSGF